MPYKKKIHSFKINNLVLKMSKPKEKPIAQIKADLKRGGDTHKIAKKYKVSWQTVAAVKAHLTMGTY
jgi:Mor family transcriptional regulator